MSALRLASLSFACLAALPACGPIVTTVRTSDAPPKPGDCAMKFVDVDPTAPDSPWTLVGQVILQGGPRDAASEEARSRVAPEACRLGGDAVTPLRDPNPSPDAQPILNYAVLKQSGPAA